MLALNGTVQNSAWNEPYIYSSMRTKIFEKSIQRQADRTIDRQTDGWTDGHLH